MKSATILLSHGNAMAIAVQFSEAVDYVEDMLRKQLIQAIGKEVTPVDFTNYMVLFVLFFSFFFMRFLLLIKKNHFFNSRQKFLHYYYLIFV